MAAKKLPHLQVEKKKKKTPTTTMKPIKQNKTKLLRRFVGYLKADSYMFAPLISDSGAEMKEPISVKTKRVVKKLEDYLKSDSYMYTPLCEPPQSFFTPSKENIRNVKKGTWERSTTKVILRRSGEGEELTESRTDKEFGCSETMIRAGQRSLLNKETVKHMICNKCRSSSARHGIFDSHVRKIVVD